MVNKHFKTRATTRRRLSSRFSISSSHDREGFKLPTFTVLQASRTRMLLVGRYNCRTVEHRHNLVNSTRSTGLHNEGTNVSTNHSLPDKFKTRPQC